MQGSLVLSTLLDVDMSEMGIFLIESITLFLVFSSVTTSSIDASIHSLTVSASVNSLLFLPNVQATRSDADVALSCSEQGLGFGVSVHSIKLAPKSSGGEHQSPVGKWCRS